MKFEIEVPDEAIIKAAQTYAAHALGVNTWHQMTGPLAPEIGTIINTKLLKAFNASDIGALVSKVIETSLVPTIEEEVKRQLKNEAKKAVKAELLKPTEALHE